MKLICTLLTLTTLSLHAEEYVTEKEWTDLNGRLSEIEAAKEIDVFKFHSTFINQYDSFVQKKQSSTEKLQTNRFKYLLGIEATPYSNLTLHSQMGIGKYYNLMEMQNGAASSDYRPVASTTQPSNRYDGKFFLRTAYLDYFPLSHPELIFSIGKLPTLDGPPSHLPDARDRLGTYPRMAYGVEGEGIALTYKVDQYLPELYSLSFRGIYHPTQYLNLGTADNYYPYYHPTYGGGGKGKTRNDSYALMGDFSIRPKHAFDEFNLIGQYTRILGFHYIDKSLEETYGLTSGTYQNNLVFGFEYFTAAATFQNIGHIGLDAHLTYLLLRTHSQGNVSTGGSSLGGMGTSKDHDVITGHAWLLSLRYKIPMNFLNGPYIGYEHIEMDRDCQFFDGGTEDQFFFYGTQGYGSHYYLTIPIFQNLTLRTGLKHQKVVWFKDIGLPTNDSSLANYTVNTIYSNLRLDF